MYRESSFCGLKKQYTYISFFRNPLYKGPLDCLLKTVKGEGVTALYKVSLIPTVCATLT